MQGSCLGPTRKVMEENLSHELLRQDLNPNFLHVYRITTSENTSCLPPFLNPWLNVPFIFPFLCFLSFPLCEMYFSMLFMDSINVTYFSSVQSLSCVRLCNPMNCSTPGLPVHHQLPEFKLSPSSRWCHPAISSSVVPFSSFPQSLPASESFPMSQLFPWGGQVLEFQL